MYHPPRDPGRGDRPRNPTWRELLVSYAVVAAIPGLLWAASNPLAGVAGAVVLLVAAGVARRAYRIVRCLATCREIVLDVGDRVRITVVRRPADDAA